MTKAQELSERYGISVDEVEAISAEQRRHMANEKAHQTLDDAEAESARNRMKHR